MLPALSLQFEHLHQPTDFHETWNEHYATGGHPQSHLSFPTLSNNTVDMQSCEVEATQTSLTLGS